LNVDITVVGSGWEVHAAALSLNECGLRCAGVRLPSNPVGWIPVSVGSGEPRATVEKIMGSALTGFLWEISEENYARARQFFPEIVPTETRWYASASPADFHSEKGFGFEEETFCRSAEARLVQLGEKVVDADEIDITSESSFVHRVKFKDGTSIGTSFVLLLHEPTAIGLYPGLSDKLIPVTLSSYTFPRRVEAGFSMALFNGGADYAIFEDVRLRLGSFRNLFEDKAVGFPLPPDPATLKGVTRFFGDQRWIDPDTKPEAHISLAAISCDGLPVVGALSEAPHVFVAGGFAGRSQNFIFEVASRLGNALRGKSSFSGLEKFSTKRFVI